MTINCAEKMAAVGFSEWRIGVGRWEIATQLLPGLTNGASCLPEIGILPPKAMAPAGFGDLELISARDWFEAVEVAIEKGCTRARGLRDALLDVASRAEALALAMDFRLLFDPEVRRFHIGYNVSADRIDPHHYDLLATEARLASFFAVAKRDVPVEHWFFLGRPVTRAGGGLALLSWGGSMFEYLMPSLLLRSHPGTLLAESERAAVETQRRYAKKLGIPWGMSESGFASLDPSSHYRYRAFGVPGLGLRRGLARDLVVAPYAAALALPISPGAAVDNLSELDHLELVGVYGFYEAADFTRDRLPPGRRVAIVRSYMAHHQGMILAAVGNALCADALVRRFHADGRVRAVELLLHERIPREVAPELARVEELRVPTPRRAALPAPGPWMPVGPADLPQLHALGNGRLSTWITESGAGALRWQGHALTRWLPDTTRDNHGLWIYVHDEESGAVWSAARQPTNAAADEASVVFHPHMAEFHRRERGIAIRMEVFVAPADDVDVRRVTVVNESDRVRVLTLTSYGEVVLAPPLDDERHPAFSKLFVASEHAAELDALLFTRRPRHPREASPVLLHRLVCDDPDLRCTGVEADRRAFLGRNGDPRRPPGVLQGLTGSVGSTLDSVMALQLRLDLEPQERRELAFLTMVAGSRESVLELAERYATLSSLGWALADAGTEMVREVQRLGLEPDRLQELQTLASLLLYPHPALRAKPASLAANQLGQPRLWGLGFSGDLPILLLQTGEIEDSALLRTLLRGHQLWRRHGIHVDLVVLRTGASSYAEPLRERLFALLQELGGEATPGRRGGIHLLFADQIKPEERRLIECVARVVLDDARGSLAHQLANAAAPPPALPPFQPSGAPLASAATPPLPRPANLLFDNGLGGFTADGREYVVHLEPGARTPAPWCNVLANEGFGCVVTEAGGGFTWAANSGENRLTPWTNDPLAGPSGEALYLRDEETGEIWTPTPQPAGTDAACQIRHGAGYTEWTRQSHGFDQRLLVFVPTEDPLKIARLRLGNLQPRTRRVTVTYYAEWLLGALPSVSRPFVVTDYEPGCHALLARNPWNPDFAGRVAFLAATRPPHGLTTDRAEFLGREGDLHRPAGLVRWGLSGRAEPGGDSCAAFQVHLDIGAGETAEVAFMLGQGRDRIHAEELVRRWQQPGVVERAFGDLGHWWDRQLGAVQVHTPDPAFDLMVNRWLLYQAVASRILARAGFYQAGGALGFRDQLQDVLALLWVDPARTRAHIIACAARQFEQGDVLHWWHPPADRGVRTRCSDDLLWLPYATSRYIEATGDHSILDEQVPFLHAPPLAPHEEDRYARFELAPERGSLFEHCARAVQHGTTRGAHGLPLIGSGDWNDGMDRVGRRGRGESVWLAWFTIAVLQGFADLCSRRGEHDLADRWRLRARDLRQAAEKGGWDGEWYLRAFDDDGRSWGSHTGDECRIDSLAQSWAVLSGAGAPERARRALESAERELVRADEGVIRLLWPPFDLTPRVPGSIMAYPPGIRDNGGQYTHAAAWLGWAFAELGDGDRAARIFELLNPIRRSADRAGVERHRVEPYVLAADIGTVAPHIGRGGWTWYTGSAAWTWRLGVEAILGLQLRDGRLVLDPCLPQNWNSFQAQIRGPAGTLAIHVENAHGARGGVAAMATEGDLHDEPSVPFPTDGSTRRVDVRLEGPRDPEADARLRASAD
jgi:cyclic beta-1,2-glucan synthetase